ncbi:MAG: hypothetical protein QM621_13270 [Aeromicrobium sp.]|uniref:hypothetical protein n=1 Tax=Aeromicrobium sp. TaxID=1871063 RepID=UPI0039E5BA7A
MAKKVIAGLVVAFALFFLLTDPAGAADLVKTGFVAVIDVFSAVGIFLQELFR